MVVHPGKNRSREHVHQHNEPKCFELSVIIPVAEYRIIKNGILLENDHLD